MAETAPESAPEEFEARQVAIAHEVLWDALEAWLGTRNCRLVRVMESTEDDLATYIVMPKVLQ